MSATPMRALMSISLCSSATPGSPIQTGSVMPAARRPASQVVMAAGIEAHLGGHRLDVRLLVGERLAKCGLRDRGVTLGVARHPDVGQAAADVRHRPQQRQAILVVARLVGVAPDDEGVVDGRGVDAGEQLRQVAAVADHARRQMRDDVEAPGLEPLAELDRGLDALGRRGGHRDRRAGRQEGRLLVDVLERDELELGRLEDAGDGGLGRRSELPSCHVLGPRRPSPGRRPSGGR